MPELFMIGEVSRAHVFPAHVASAFCRFRVLTGPGWVLLDGAPGGQTQAAVVDRSAQPFLAAEGGTAEFGHPLDVHFGATSVSGWPQLEVTVWGQDGLSRNEILGYGVARVPPSPGVHTLEVGTWRPLGTPAQEASAYFLGGTPHLADPGVVADGAARSGLATVSSVVVAVEVQVLAAGWEAVGVTLCEP